MVRSCSVVSGRVRVRIKNMISQCMSQLAKTLDPSCYCLYSVFNKIRDKGRIVSAGY
jgi:hypothetical protein